MFRYLLYLLFGRACALLIGSTLPDETEDECYSPLVCQKSRHRSAQECLNKPTPTPLS